MRIVGTAGHVDHGKSALVISLTGHDPDRLAEERERGMTLDLGFAPMRFDDGVEAGVVDVPGHERFLHNMLAGAAGMDVLLLVVDAVEGPRRQTFEHLAILEYLNVRRAIVVITKSDLVDATRIAAIERDVRGAFAGTIADGAPVVAVSNLTGSGIAGLKAAIHDALVVLPPHNVEAPVYLPVDRAFALPGHGTIVTGTLMQGAIEAGDALALQPSGRHVRVRSLQTFGRKFVRVEAGARVAVNVPGIAVDEVARGDVLASPQFHPQTRIEVGFSAHRSALAFLRRRMAVRVHIGSAEIPGRLVFSDAVPADVAPSAAHVELRRPAVVFPGMRIVLRRMSPKDLLGGAVAMVDLPLVLGEQESAAREVLDGGSVRLACLRALEASALDPLPVAALASSANATIAAVRDAMAALVDAGDAVAVHKPDAYVSRRSADAAFERVIEALRTRHGDAPWRLGCTGEELARAAGTTEAVAARLLAAWHNDGRVASRSGIWHRPGFAPHITPDQRQLFERALDGRSRSMLMPVSFEAVRAVASGSKIAGATEALDSLVATGALVRVGDDLYRKSQIERAKSAIVDVLAHCEHGATMAQLREALGTSRRYALPLMEHFDSIGFTTRDGDLRRLRASTGNGRRPFEEPTSHQPSRSSR